MISIIIPIYNCAKYLPACVAAIRAQTYTDWELILSDDGSTDGGYELMQKFAEEDSRIKVLHSEKSQGAGPARNSGIDAATGDFLMFIDADDVTEPDMLEKLEAAISDGFDVAICGYRCFVEGVGQTDVFAFDGAELREDGLRKFFAEKFPDGVVGYLWNKIYRASVIRENNIRFPAMRRLQDGVFNVKFFSVAKSAKIIEDTLYRYRINPQTDMFRKCPPDYFDLIKKFSLDFIGAKKDWGEFSNAKIYGFFLNEAGTCVENCFAPDRNMSKKERKDYFRALREDGLMKEALAANVPLGKYRRFLLKNLDNYTLLKTGIMLKVKLKSLNRTLFYKLKGSTK